jgi:hypothetical protein
MRTPPGAVASANPATTLAAKSLSMPKLPTDPPAPGASIEALQLSTKTTSATVWHASVVVAATADVAVMLGSNAGLGVVACRGVVVRISAPVVAPVELDDGGVVVADVRVLVVVVDVALGVEVVMVMAAVGVVVVVVVANT